MNFTSFTLLVDVRELRRTSLNCFGWAEMADGCKWALVSVFHIYNTFHHLLLPFLFLLSCRFCMTIDNSTDWPKLIPSNKKNPSA